MKGRRSRCSKYFTSWWPPNKKFQTLHANILFIIKQSICHVSLWLKQTLLTIYLCDFPSTEVCKAFEWEGEHIGAAMDCESFWGRYHFFAPEGNKHSAFWQNSHLNIKTHHGLASLWLTWCICKHFRHPAVLVWQTAPELWRHLEQSIWREREKNLTLRNAENT